MADEVTKKEFDALVKKVNNKFAEIDKWQKAEEGYRATIVETSNNAIKTLGEADKTLVAEIDKAKKYAFDEITKTIKGVNDAIAQINQRLAALEKSKLF